MGEDDLPERYFSVDVEANGPVPGPYSMTSLGCAVVGATELTFYAELKPISEQVSPAAEAVSGLTLEHLATHGSEPGEAMRAFHDWVVATAGMGHRPVFVGLNAPFDWMFVHWYLMRFVGQDPFGVSGLDIKAYCMGLLGLEWGQTGGQALFARFGLQQPTSHHALDDARAQAVLFAKMLAHEARRADD